MDWNERYSVDEYLFGRDPAQALLRNEEHLVSNGTTSVIADAEGRNSVYLALRKASKLPLLTVQLLRIRKQNRWQSVKTSK